MKLEFHHINFVSKDVDKMNDFYKKLKSLRERQSLVKPSVKHINKIIKASYIQKLRDKEASL